MIYRAPGDKEDKPKGERPQQIPEGGSEGGEQPSGGVDPRGEGVGGTEGEQDKPEQDKPDQGGDDQAA